MNTAQTPRRKHIAELRHTLFIRLIRIDLAAGKPQQNRNSHGAYWHEFVIASYLHLSLPPSCAYLCNGDNKYEITRRRPVLISAVTAIPGASVSSRPSTTNRVLSSATCAT